MSMFCLLGVWSCLACLLMKEGYARILIDWIKVISCLIFHTECKVSKIKNNLMRITYLIDFDCNNEKIDMLLNVFEKTCL